MVQVVITEHELKTDRHTTFYLAAGPETGPLIIFTHGWPELSLSWRHQLPFFGAMGFRTIAPDMRGYGRSSIYGRHEDYCLAHTSMDMLELIDSLDREKAVWVGHDWGSPVAWNMASHYPDRCHAVSSLCVPYASIERGLDTLIDLADRSIYPVDEYPAAQWDYMRFYEENFDLATAQMDANPLNMVQLIFRTGSPDGMGQPAGTAKIRSAGGWFGGLPEPPSIPRDGDVITEGELEVYADGLKRNGFFGPNAWYMNHKANATFHHQVVNNGRINMPVLFLAARYDFVCESVVSGLTGPMRDQCNNLTEKVLDSGHWMAQEKPFEVNREIVKWLALKVPDVL